MFATSQLIGQTCLHLPICAFNCFVGFFFYISQKPPQASVNTLQICRLFSFTSMFPSPFSNANFQNGHNKQGDGNAAAGIQQKNEEVSLQKGSLELRKWRPKTGSTAFLEASNCIEINKGELRATTYVTLTLIGNNDCWHGSWKRNKLGNVWNAYRRTSWNVIAGGENLF